MDWKHVKLYCPHCQFTHDFKRITWWELEGVFIGLYGTDDMESRKSCDKELVYGEATYEVLTSYLNGKAEELVPKMKGVAGC